MMQKLCHKSKRFSSFFSNFQSIRWIFIISLNCHHFIELNEFFLNFFHQFFNFFQKKFKFFPNFSNFFKRISIFSIEFPINSQCFPNKFVLISIQWFLFKNLSKVIHSPKEIWSKKKVFYSIILIMIKLKRKKLVTHL